MKIKELENYLRTLQASERIGELCAKDDWSLEKERYLKLLILAQEAFGDGDYHYISSPGRSEIGGNHTDHQRGCVVAAALNVDNLAIVKKSDDEQVTFIDPKFGRCVVDLRDLTVREQEKNTSAALIRGIAAAFKNEGYQIGGFMAYCDSQVLSGSGISSRACFELLVVECLNALYNNAVLDSVKRAQIAQYAENVYFGKPCGLMDQLAISAGGFVTIDFKDKAKPLVEHYDYSFDADGYELVLVNTRGNHANLSDEYAAVTEEIKAVAQMLGKEVLRDIPAKDFYAALPLLKAKLHNDRALLRCIHFYQENQRAIAEKTAIAKKDTNSLLKLMRASGASSFMYLQNVYPASAPKTQELALALAISDEVLSEEGAFRVHGGGFAGTIQAIVPNGKIAEYCKRLEELFGEGSCMRVKVRPSGTTMII